MEPLESPDEIERNHDWLAAQPRPTGVPVPGSMETLAAIGERITRQPGPVDRLTRKFRELFS